MKPRNIRFSSWRSKLYVPTMDDGAVVEIDPLTNNVTAIYTGFDCPWDILDTGSQVFAIQLGVVGLKKVL